MDEAADGSTGSGRSLRSIAPGRIRAPAESSMVSARTRLWKRQAPPGAKLFRSSLQEGPKKGSGLRQPKSAESRGRATESFRRDEMASEAQGGRCDQKEMRTERHYPGRGRSADAPLARQALEKPPLIT